MLIKKFQFFLLTSLPFPLFKVPPFTVDELAPLIAGSKDKKFLIWDNDSEKVKRFTSQMIKDRSFLDLPEIEVLYSEDNAIVSADNSVLNIMFKKGKYKNFRLVVLTERMLSISKINEKGQKSEIHFKIPVFALPGNKFFWWVEAKDDNDRTTARSRLMSL